MSLTPSLIETLRSIDWPEIATAIWPSRASNT